MLGSHCCQGVWSIGALYPLVYVVCSVFALRLMVVVVYALGSTETSAYGFVSSDIVSN